MERNDRVETRKVLPMLAFLVMVVILLLVGCDGTEDSKNGETKVSLDIGSIVETKSSSEVILCATTQDNFKLMNKYLAADDKTAAEKMFLNGKLLLLKTGTKVKILQVTFNGVEVRVQHGDYKDKTVWLSRDFLK
jgi:uncharacterized lipoprotein YehR (DUF1307 family)